MTNTFFISDTHFGHTNSWLKFKREDGTPLRPFTSTEEMDDTMVDNWNKKVGPKDRIYHLGDFCMRRKDLQTFSRLNGRICLLLGNHDVWKRADYDKWAPNIDTFQGVKMMPKLGWILSHVPVYSDIFGDLWKYNIHGHLHHKNVKYTRTSPIYGTEGCGYGSAGWVKRGGQWCYDEIDERYFNVSVEQIDYTPISLEELKERL